MSTATPSSEYDPAAIQAPASAATTFQLAASNQSSTLGDGYFNVYPPALTNPPASVQTLLALVSDGISQGNATSMTWQGGSGALALFALAAGSKLADAPREPVALGDTVTLDWANGAFTFTAASGGPADSIVLTFAPAVPVDTCIGMVVGPGAILVGRAGSQANLTLTPDLSPMATVVFGTAFQFPAGDFSDVGAPQLITFTPIASSAEPTAGASIEVNADNLIVQIG